MSGQYHDNETDNQEYELTALVNNKPYLAHLVYQIGGGEANLHEFSLPVHLTLIVVVHLEHIAIV